MFHVKRVGNSAFSEVGRRRFTVLCRGIEAFVLELLGGLIRFTAARAERTARWVNEPRCHFWLIHQPAGFVL
jgi:hypothetical protein